MGISWDTSVLYPQSLNGILANLGVIINAFGFMLILFPLYVLFSLIHSLEKLKGICKADDQQISQSLSHPFIHSLCCHRCNLIPYVQIRST